MGNGGLESFTHCIVTLLQSGVANVISSVEQVLQLVIESLTLLLSSFSAEK